MRCSRSGSCCSARACSRTGPAWSGGRRRPRRVGHGHLVSAHRQHARAAALPRQGHDCARVARRAASGVGRDHRAPRASRLSSTGSPMLRDQVFVLDHMYMSVFSTCGWILRLGVTVALLMSIHPALVLLARLRAADGAHVDLASRRSSASRRSAAPRPIASLGTCSPPRRRRRRARRCASPASAIAWCAERREAWERWYLPGVDRALGVGAVAHAGVGDLRRRRTSARSCSSRRASALPPGDVLLVLAAGSRLSAYIGATVGEIGFLRGFWMDGSRRLAWLEDYAASLAASADLPCPGRTAPRHPPRARVVRVPGHVAPRARRRVALAARRLGRRRRRRERRRQDDAGQAAGEDVRAFVRVDSRGRHAARPHAGRRVALASGRRVSGFLPLRVPRAPHRRRRRRPPPGRRAGRRHGRGARRRRTTSSRDWRRASRRSWARRGLAASTCRSASGRSSRWRAASCATIRCCSCSTSRRRRSMPRPSTPCSSATRPRRTADRANGRHHAPGLAPVLDRAHGRPHRRARRRPARRGRHARRADGQRADNTPSSTAFRPRPIADWNVMGFGGLRASGKIAECVLEA